MSQSYEPSSDFLNAIIAEEVPLTGSDFAAANLKRLMLMTTDQDRANRDWATMLLSQQDIDTAEVRQVLLVAADDEDQDVRAEAVLGLAQRSSVLALPCLLKELSAERVTLPVFEAAGLVAHASLVEPLRNFFEGRANDPGVDEAILSALNACETGTPVDS